MRLLAISPGDGRDLRPWLDAMAEAGLAELLLREKQARAEEVAAMAAFAVARIPVVRVHADCAGARALGLPLHLSGGATTHHGAGWSSSCHSAVEVDRALGLGADFCLYSPVFSPTSKQDGRATLGEAGFLAVGRGRAVLALGGITPSRAARLHAQGCTGVAVLGDLFGQPTPADAAARVRAYSQL